MNRPDQPNGKAVALATFIKLMRASESVASDVHRQITAGGLTVSQFGILEALFHLGPMTQKELAGKILKSAGNITMVIDNLEKQDLVTRTRNNEDRRSYLISPTSKGKALITEIFPAHAERISTRMAHLSLEEQRALGRLLKKLGTTKKQQKPQGKNDTDS